MPAQALHRRVVLARLLGSAAVTALPWQAVSAWGAAPAGVSISDGALTIDVDAMMRSRISFNGVALTGHDQTDALRPAGAPPIDHFTLTGHQQIAVTGPHGPGVRHVLRASAAGQISLERAVTFFRRYPGLAIIETQYQNRGTRPLAIAGWRSITHDLLEHPDGAWSFSGASYPDRRDWIQRVGPGFEQQNFMGMNGSDYGGGTPAAVVWRRDAGLAVGHVETVPHLVSFPVSAQPAGIRLGMASHEARVIAAGASMALPTAFVSAQPGDHFKALDAYRRIMGERGLRAPQIPRSSYGPIWCAWGYDRNYTADQVVATLPKVKSLGFEWAVLDDGWQVAEGDWRLDPVKYPGGDADMRTFVGRIKAEGMRPRLWLAPLAADPGSALLRDHSDMLLLDEDGAAQNVSWWNAYTLCPAYPPTISYFKGVVRQIMGDWGYEGLKLDGQHLNGVAPCYNPAHHHARPEESFEKLQDFWKAIYDEAISINPEAVIEICPCGDSFAFHNIMAMNNTPASDPESSWQVRLKGKTFKALMGPSAPYSGDHVELSDGHDDFASTYGIGGIPSTKFTWPRDTDRPTTPLPPGGFLLTAEKEAMWRRWIDLYQANRLAEGEYLGGLYDIGFDRPEGHAVRKDGSIHYAFYAKDWDGPITLRGLEKGDYVISDGFTGKSLGRVEGGKAVIAAKFDRFLLVKAVRA
jgi:alpha-galactosidase